MIQRNNPRKLLAAWEKKSIKHLSAKEMTLAFYGEVEHKSLAASDGKLPIQLNLCNGDRSRPHPFNMPATRGEAKG